MKLSIGRVDVRAKLPKRLHARAPDVARLVREVLPRAMARDLHRLPSRPAVSRIRRVHVRVRLNARELDEAHFAKAWADAFFRALLTAINQPPASGSAFVAASREEWLAEVMRAILDGRFSGWMFDEFAAYEGQAANDTLLAVVRDRDADWPAVLAMLARTGQLERLTRLLSTAGCRQFVRLSSQRGLWATPSSIDDLVWIARLLLDGRAMPPRPLSDPIDLVVIRLVATVHGQQGHRYSPEGLRCGLVALRWLAAQLTADPAGRRNGIEVPRDELIATPALLAVAYSAAEGWPTAQDQTRELTALRSALERLIEADGVLRTIADVRHGAVAGLLLLAATIDRAEWPERIRRTALGAQYGSHAVTYVLAGIALALLGHPASTAPQLDPGVAMLAGWFDAPDAAAIRRMCSRHDHSTCLALVHALVGDDVEVDAIAGWDSAFAALGSWLIRRFAERLRGLSRSSERFIVDRILAVPGVITIDERHVSARLHANPFWPVVRLSAADEPVAAVSWMGGRRLAFDLEGV
jgi:hypothetical protein